MANIDINTAGRNRFRDSNMCLLKIMRDSNGVTINRKRIYLLLTESGFSYH
jgi:hypothetical protein